MRGCSGCNDTLFSMYLGKVLSNELTIFMGQWFATVALTRVNSPSFCTKVLLQQRWRHCSGACTVAEVQGQNCVCVCVCVNVEWAAWWWRRAGADRGAGAASLLL